MYALVCILPNSKTSLSILFQKFYSMQSAGTSESKSHNFSENLLHMASLPNPITTTFGTE
jgi:hypothetical protein